MFFKSRLFTCQLLERLSTVTIVSACPDNSSGTCTAEVAVVLRYDSLESWRAAVYVLIDLAPLTVYLPLLILFNAVIMLLLFIICNGASIATSIEAPFGGLFHSSASTTTFRQQQSVNNTSTMVLYRMVVSSMALCQQWFLAQRQACLGYCAMCITQHVSWSAQWIKWINSPYGKTQLASLQV